jgi:L-aminopeptidase/D-esterase-like protein
MKAGVGTWSIRVNGVRIGALAAVNAIGDVIDPQNGERIAGMRMGTSMSFLKKGSPRAAVKSNTVIGVVATDAKLTKSQATRVAQMAQDGLARVIRPAHTLFDGDTIFALATSEQHADVSMVGAFAAEVMAEAILRAVKLAAPAGGLHGLFQSTHEKTRRG